MKSSKELHALKAEVAALAGKLSELTEDELAQVTGGLFPILLSGAGSNPPQSVFTDEPREP